MRDYTTSDFDYHLPDELIAQVPLPERTASRLLAISAARQSIEHFQFKQLTELLRPNDLLIFNNTRVIPARLFGYKATGGKIECLVERILGEHAVLAHIRASKAPKPGAELVLADQIKAVVTQRHGDLFELNLLHDESVLSLLETYGSIPLPTYIERAPDAADKNRYQTVYAKVDGAVAAPTAGLHFDQALLAELRQLGVQTAFVTLHVGAGTFQPVRVENLDEHEMHTEYMEVTAAVCEAVAACRAAGGRVVAVGTTSVRCLETAAKDGALKPYCGDTALFIRPGFQFQCVDALITNFHLPKSSLLMLVSALAGYDLMMQAYQAAVQQRYRFYSYGDAMFIDLR